MSIWWKSSIQKSWEKNKGNISTSINELKKAYLNELNKNSDQNIVEEISNEYVYVASSWFEDEGDHFRNKFEFQKLLTDIGNKLLNEVKLKSYFLTISASGRKIAKEKFKKYSNVIGVS